MRERGSQCAQYLQISIHCSLIADEPHFCVKCEDEDSNLCRRVLRQMLEQNKARITECREYKDGVWGAWEDLEPCKSLGAYCPPRPQQKRCQRSLGGKYCRNEEREVPEGFLFRTEKCEPEQCQGLASALPAGGVMIHAPELVFVGDQIELICQAGSNHSDLNLTWHLGCESKEGIKSEVTEAISSSTIKIDVSSSM